MRRLLHLVEAGAVLAGTGAQTHERTDLGLLPVLPRNDRRDDSAKIGISRLDPYRKHDHTKENTTNVVEGLVRGIYRN